VSTPLADGKIDNRLSSPCRLDTQCPLHAFNLVVTTDSLSRLQTHEFACEETAFTISHRPRFATRRGREEVLG